LVGVRWGWLKRGVGVGGMWALALRFPPRGNETDEMCA